MFEHTEEKPKVDLYDPTVFYDKGSYAITINPDDKHQWDGKFDRLQLFKNWMNELMLPLPVKGIEYYLNVELSEPNESIVKGSIKKPRLHCHGYIVFRSKKAVRAWLLTEFYRVSKESHVFIKRIDNWDKWFTYITKQQHIMDTSPITNCDDLVKRITPVTSDEESGEAEKGIKKL